MSLPVPPKYIVVPLQVIEQAYQPDKPRRALFASFVRVLSLAWENKYERTPLLNEQELWEFLKLSRRQYFEQKADMELLGWLRSSHPVPGFVQFTFSRMLVETAPVVSAENSQADAKNRTALKRIEEEESLIDLNTESSSSIPQTQVRKTAPAKNDAFEAKTESEKEIQRLVENLSLLFAPAEHGLLEMRAAFLACVPEKVLGWVAKAYQDRERLGSPLGFLVKHMTEGDSPNPYYLNSWSDILPEAYLEAVGLVTFECDYCQETFASRSEKDQHQRSGHPYVCLECNVDCGSADAQTQHYRNRHDPFRDRPEPVAIEMPELDGALETTWTAVLSQLQQEMPKASFDTWMRDTKAIRYDGNTLTIGTRNSYARDWVANHQAAKIAQLAGALLKKPVTVVVVVMDGAMA